MLRISKESLAPKLFENRLASHRANAQGRVHEIVYCMFLCGAFRRSAQIEEVAGQAVTTYPQYFHTWVNDDYVPDLAIILVNLDEAISGGLVRGNWHEGWRLTQRGRNVALDIDRRRNSDQSSH
jgi:hypothetical protein